MNGAGSFASGYATGADDSPSDVSTVANPLLGVPPTVVLLLSALSVS